MNIDGSARIRLLLLTAVSLFVIGARFFWATPVQARWFIQYAGYYSLALCSLITIAALYGFWRTRRQVEWRTVLIRHRWALIGMVCVTALTHLHEPHRFKVMNDEHALLVTSKMMHEYREASIPGYVHHYYGQMEYGARYPGKRSLFFQFLLAGVHDLTGYRPENAFILNFAATGVFYIGLYVLAYQLTRRKRIAAVAMFLAFGVPLLAHVATSGGYDLLNSAMLMLLGVMLYQMLRAEDVDTHLQTLLIYVCLLAAQVRYESLLYLFPMALIVLIHWIRIKRVHVGWLDVCSPVFLLLPLFLNLNMHSNPALMDDRVREEGEAFMSVEYLADNALDAFDYYFVPDLWKTNSVVVSVLGVIGMVVVVVSVLSRIKHLINGQRNAHAYAVVASMLFAAMACFLIMLSNFWGQLTDYQATRFALPMYMVGVLCIVLLLSEIRIPDRLFSKLLIGLGLCVSCLSIASSARSYITHSMVPSYATALFLDFAKTKNPRDSLFIAGNVPALASAGFASFPPEALKDDPLSLLRLTGNGIYKGIYAIEVLKVNAQTGDYTISMNQSKLADDFICETVEELNFMPLFQPRIVEVVGIRLEDGREIYFDEFTLPERSFESNQEFSEYFLQQYPNALPREPNNEELILKELGLVPVAGYEDSP